MSGSFADARALRPLDASGRPAVLAEIGLGTDETAGPHPRGDTIAGFGLLTLDGTATQTGDLATPAGLLEALAMPAVSDGETQAAGAISDTSPLTAAPEGLRRFLSNPAVQDIVIAPAADGVVTGTAAEPESPSGILLDLAPPGAPESSSSTEPPLLRRSEHLPAVSAEAIAPPVPDGTTPVLTENAGDTLEPSLTPNEPLAVLPTPEASETEAAAPPAAKPAGAARAGAEPGLALEGVVIASAGENHGATAGAAVVAPGEHRARASSGAAVFGDAGREATERAAEDGDLNVPPGLRSSSGADIRMSQPGAIPLASIASVQASLDLGRERPTAEVVAARPVELVAVPRAEVRRAAPTEPAALPSGDAGGSPGGSLPAGAQRPGLAVSRAAEMPPPQATSSDFVDRLARTLVESHQAGRPFQVRLHPPELGLLQIELTSRGGALTARLDVETSAARQVILEQLPQLRDVLGHAGHNVERIDVHLLERSDSQPQQDSRGRHSHQEASPEEPREPPDESRGPHDEDGDPPPGFTPHGRTRSSAPWERFDLQV